MECNIDANRGSDTPLSANPLPHAFRPVKLLRESFHGPFSSVSHPYVTHVQSMRLMTSVPVIISYNQRERYKRMRDVQKI